MNHNHSLNKLVSSVSQTLDRRESFSLSLLNVKLQKLASEYPNDSTIGAVTQILSKAESNNKMLITRAELKDIYTRFYTRNTKFAHFFQNELGEKVVVEQVAPQPKQDLPLANLHESVADPVLSNALATAFDASIPFKPFAKQHADRAQLVVNQNLDAWNLKASKLSIDGGNEHFIVVRADYDTPKGTTSVLVPVEVNQNKVLEPTFFMGNAGPFELNHSNLKDYILSQAGQTLKVRSTDVAQVLASAVHPKTEVSQLEMALTKINASRTPQQEYHTNSILGQSLDTLPTEVQMPKSPEFESFAEKFSTPEGAAELHFGRDKVALGSDAVRRILAQLGISHVIVKVADCSENTIFYAVSAHNGQLAIKVPVKMVNNRVQSPDLFLCNGSISSLTVKELQRAMTEEKTDTRAMAITSPQYGLKPSELIENVRQAMSEKNLSKAEDALNILHTSGDIKAYAIAFNLYKDGLSLEKVASKEEQCSLVIQSKTSKYPLCGHTGLPLHKIYVDKFGNCHPMYRKGMDETTEELYMMHTKIFG